LLKNQHFIHMGNPGKILLTLILMLCATSLFSQDLEVTKKGLYKDGSLVSPRDWVSVMDTNEEAIKFAKKAKTNKTMADIFAYTGGFLIGWPIGTAIGGGEPEWALAGVGAGLAAIAIPFTSGAKKNLEKAVEVYGSPDHSVSAEVRVGFTGNGLGLVIKF